MGALIRKATLKDRDQIVSMLVSLAKKYPLRADKDKIKALITEMISGSSHFAQVVESSGVIKGCLFAFVAQHHWAQKLQAQILAWTSEIPGKGVAMLRNFKRWVLSRAGIRVAGMSPDTEIDSRIWVLAHRVGFLKKGGCCILYTRGKAHWIL